MSRFNILIKVHYLDQNQNMDKAIQEMELTIQEIVTRPDLHPDTINYPDTKDQQALLFIAEIHAAEDAIYHMSQAFGQSRHDPIVFIKNIRSLAREQFMKRIHLKRLDQY